MDVSENNGTPKSSILIGFSIINHPFWGTPIFGNTHIDKEIVYTINGTCIKNQGLLETFGQFASPQKATSFLGNVPGWNVAPWSLQRHLKWSNSSRYTKNGQRLRKFLAPKMTWIQGWNMIIEISWFLNMLFDLPRHMVEKPEKQLLQTHWPVLIFQVKNGATLSGSIDARRGVRYSTAVDFPSSV